MSTPETTEDTPYRMTSKAKKRKNHTARSKSKSALAPADCVQMIGPANMKLKTERTPIITSRMVSRFEAYSADASRPRLLRTER